MIDYGFEKLSAAAEILATGVGSLGERLADAYESQLHRIDPKEDLPGLYVDDFVGMLSECSRLGSFDETIRMMTEERQTHIAIQLVRMAFQVGRMLPQDEA